MRHVLLVIPLIVPLIVQSRRHCNQNDVDIGTHSSTLGGSMWDDVYALVPTENQDFVQENTQIWPRIYVQTKSRALNSNSNSDLGGIRIWISETKFQQN